MEKCGLSVYFKDEYVWPGVYKFSSLSLICLPVNICATVENRNFVLVLTASSCSSEILILNPGEGHWALSRFSSVSPKCFFLFP